MSHTRVTGSKVPTVALALTMTAAGSRGSNATTPVASLGPLLLTVIV